MLYEVITRYQTGSGLFNGKPAWLHVCGSRSGSLCDSVRLSFPEFPQLSLPMDTKWTPKTVITSYSIHYTKLYEWALFEPRSATSRRNVFQEAFPESFRSADRVVIAGLFAPEGIAPADRLDPERVVRDIRAQGGCADYIPDVEDIVECIAARNNFV